MLTLNTLGRHPLVLVTRPGSGVEFPQGTRTGDYTGDLVLVSGPYTAVQPPHGTQMWYCTGETLVHNFLLNIYTPPPQPTHAKVRSPPLGR